MTFYLSFKQNLSYVWLLIPHVEMTTGRVWAGFFYIRTQPAGLDPARLLNGYFFSGPRPTPWAPFRPTRVRPIRSL